MSMKPDEIAELSRLLDEALALEPSQRAPWLDELEQTKPKVARRLRGMLDQAEGSDTGVLPKLDSIEADDAVARAGERVGPYLLLHEIGRGGMGSVWLAERADGAYKRRVALKLPRLAWAAGLGKRMTRERDIGALLEHPNIARLYDAGVDEHGRPYIAMEYIDGQPIDVYCRDNALDLRTRLKLFLEVAQAVAYAHGRLVLHRDLKPANVLVDAGGHVHLLDFGIAKLLDDTGAGADLTQEQGRALTLNYASPEQIAGRPLGVTADVYSLGVLLFELLTGTVPYKAKRNTTGAIEDVILAGDAPLASSRVTDKRLVRELRGDLDAILAKAIKRDPSERYPTADALAADIRRYLDGYAIEARPDSAWYRLRKAVIRHKVPVMAASAVLVVALVGVTTTLMQGRRTAEEAERARLATAFVTELFRVNATQGAPIGDGSARASPAVFVDRGAQLIEARFQGQPELQAELYGAVGRVYVDLGVDRLAIEYATRQLTSLRAQRASGHRIARSLMLLSDAALAAERDVDAEDFALQAVAALPKNDVVFPDALALLARAQARNGKFEEVERSVTEGKRMLKAQGVSKSLPGAWLTFAEGYRTSVQNRYDEALPLYEAAIAQAIEADGPLSNAAIEMRLWLALGLFSRNRSEEGLKAGEAAVEALKSLGGINSVRAERARAKLQTKLFEVTADYEGTTAVLEEVSAHLRSHSSVIPAEVMADVDFMRAKIYSERGEFSLAKPLIDSSAPVLLGKTQSNFTRFDVTSTQGRIAMYLGDHEAADSFYRQRSDARIRMGQASHPFAAYDWAYIALNLSMQGRHHEAEEILLNAPKFSDMQGDRPGRHAPQYSRAIPQALARIRLDAADIRGAQQVLPAAESLQEDWGDVASLHQTRGEIRCATGDFAGGLADLTRSISSQSTHSGPNHPWIARARAVAGLCALAQGHRKQAEELAEQARRVYVAQPGVSPYFREPLKQIEALLGAKSTSAIR